MKISREMIGAWAGSLSFHTGLVVLLYFLHFSIPAAQQQEFVEFSLGSSGGEGFGSVPIGTSMPPGGPPAEEAQGTAASGVGVDLPLSTHEAPSDDEIRMAPTRKLAAEEGPLVPGGTSKVTPSVDRELRNAGPVGFPGGKDAPTGKLGSPMGSDLAPSFNPGGGGGNVGFEIQWAGGRRRNLISGDLPKYPENTKVSAQIRLRLTVLPSGAVKSVEPMQKGDTRLENAAIKQTRMWRFAPLQSGQQQVDQRCVVTFNFRLQ